jgi:hypothetical protein
MKVRIQLGGGRPVLRVKGKNRGAALAFAALLAPAVLSTYVLGIWRLSTDAGFSGDFEIKEGMFSHWQVWIALGAALNILAVMLNRYGHGGDFRLPWKPRREKPDAGGSVPQQR